MHPALNAFSASDQRDFAKQYVSMVTHLAAWRPRTENGTHNSAGTLYEKHSIPFDADPPLWFKRLAREFAENAAQLVRVPEFRPILSELRRVDRSKLSNVSAVLHFILAPYEYKFLDACAEYGQSQGMVFKDDCLGGGLWLRGSLPLNRTIDAVFADMTDYARTATGFRAFKIRNKPIELPPMVPIKGSRFPMQGYVDLGDSGADALFEMCNRFFCSMQGRSKAVVVETQYMDGSDIVECLIERSDDEFIKVYKSCKITVTPSDGGKSKTVPVPVWWLDRTDRNIKQRVDFLSTQAERTANPEVLSCFSGLRLDASEPLTYSESANHQGVRLIEAHISDILADGDPETYEYLRHWHAWAIQKREKSGVVVVLVGPPGAGKSTLYFKSTHNNPVFKEIFGNAYMGSNGLTQLVARFNINSVMKLFSVCEEIGVKEGQRYMAEVKYQADSDTVHAEAKHLDTQAVKDKKNILMCTNYENVSETLRDPRLKPRTPRPC